MNNTKSQSLVSNNLQNQDENTNKLFIGGIPPDTNEGKAHFSLTILIDELHNYFSKFGELIGVYTPFNKKKNCLKGFAFVVFKSRQAYLKVLEFGEHFLRGKMMKAREALRQNDADDISKHLQSQKLFAKGFPFDTREEEILDFFTQFGKVNRVLMCFHKSNNFRGFAYVVMETRQGFQAAIEASNNGNGLNFRDGQRVFVSNSKSKEEMNKINNNGNKAFKNNNRSNKSNKLAPSHDSNHLKKAKNRRGSGFKKERKTDSKNNKIRKRSSFSSNGYQLQEQVQNSQTKRKKYLNSSKIQGFYDKTITGDFSKFKLNDMENKISPSEYHGLIFNTYGSKIEYHNGQIFAENALESSNERLRFNYEGLNESRARFNHIKMFHGDHF